MRLQCLRHGLPGRCGHLAPTTFGRGSRWLLPANDARCSLQDFNIGLQRGDLGLLGFDSLGNVTHAGKPTGGRYDVSNYRCQEDSGQNPDRGHWAKTRSEDAEVLGKCPRNLGLPSVRAARPAGTQQSQERSPVDLAVLFCHRFSPPYRSGRLALRVVTTPYSRATSCCRIRLAQANVRVTDCNRVWVAPDAYGATYWR